MGQGPLVRVEVQDSERYEFEIDGHYVPSLVVWSPMECSLVRVCTCFLR